MTEKLSNCLELVEEARLELSKDLTETYISDLCSKKGLTGTARFVILNELSLALKKDISGWESVLDICIIDETELCWKDYEDGDDSEKEPYYYFILGYKKGLSEKKTISVESILDNPKKFKYLFNLKIITYFKRKVTAVLKDENLYAFDYLVQDVKGCFKKMSNL